MFRHSGGEVHSRTTAEDLQQAVDDEEEREPDDQLFWLAALLPEQNAENAARGQADKGPGEKAVR